MDTAVPLTPEVSPYTWQDADAATLSSMGAGPQVSQPPVDDTSQGETLKAETPRSATIRRVATGVAGVGLVAAAVVATKMLRGANASASANVIDFDD